jgi:hypothetical protein
VMAGLISAVMRFVSLRHAWASLLTCPPVNGKAQARIRQEC